MSTSARRENELATRSAIQPQGPNAPQSPPTSARQKMGSLSIEKMQEMTPEQLSRWLSMRLEEKFSCFKAAFLEQRIDGEVFMDLNMKLLKEMVPDSPIGFRLHLLKFRTEAMQAERVSRRNMIVMEGEGKVDPPGSKAQFCLTNAALKIVYTFDKKLKLEDTKHESRTRTVTSRFVDFIDLNTIEDIDFEETTDIEETITPMHSGCCCWAKTTEHITRKQTQVIKLFISLNSAPHTREAATEKNSLNLALTIYNIELGEKFHNALLNAREEAQKIQRIEFQK